MLREWSIKEDEAGRGVCSTHLKRVKPKLWEENVKIDLRLLWGGLYLYG